MRYAKLKKLPRRSWQLPVMDGIDNSSYAGPGTLQQAYNLSGDGRPFWKTRPTRGRWHCVNQEQNEENSGMFALNDPISGACTLEEGLCWTAGKKIYIGGRHVQEIELTDTPKKQLLPMGRDLFVVPDGVFLHRDEQGVWTKKSADPHFVAEGDMFLMGGSDKEGIQKRYAVAGREPEDRYMNIYDWIDTSVSPAVIRRYNTTDDVWNDVEYYGWFVVYPGLHEEFRVGDIVNITAPGKFSLLNAQVYKVDVNMIYVTGDIYDNTDEGSGMHIQRFFPAIDHAAVCGNRVWGCRYGENTSGEFVNEIFCSALGDPLTWNRYGTGADDCYCVSLGAPGVFTGAAVLYDDVLFFKENTVFCVSGTEPADFRVACNEGKGVRNGCESSIARLGSNIVYCGTDGVYRTNGVYTLRLCNGLQPIALENAAGGVIGEKYYLAAQTQDGEDCMYVFTAGQDAYHREDNACKVQYFVPQRNSLYMLCQPMTLEAVGISVYFMMIMITDYNAPGKYTNCLMTEGKLESDYGYADETELRWYALTNALDCGTNDTKCIREVNVRFDLAEASLLCIDLRTDRGESRTLGRFTGQGIRSRTLHVNMLPCEEFQLYFYGNGSCSVRDVEIVYECAKGEMSRV